jgi:2-aminoethylphosphonate-pyruvate transaminase
MLKHARIAHAILRAPEDQPVDPVALDALLTQDRDVTHVAIVHCETTTGILNPLEAIGCVARKHGKINVVDAMSSFGAIPIDFEACGIDFLISSANKCVEGVPGFSFVLCRRKQLVACDGYARSLSLDLLGQLKGFEKNGQFRYTPPRTRCWPFARHSTRRSGKVGWRRAARDTDGITKLFWRGCASWASGFSSCFGAELYHHRF